MAVLAAFGVGLVGAGAEVVRRRQRRVAARRLTQARTSSSERSVSTAARTIAALAA
jgi:hypothetical protein